MNTTIRNSTKNHRVTDGNDEYRNGTPHVHVVFPFACGDYTYLPATETFMGWAASQDIPGVHWFTPDWTHSHVMTGDGWVVADTEADVLLLQEKARGKYTIVV